MQLKQLLPFLLILMTSFTAFAAEPGTAPSERGLQLGARLGYAIPQGSIVPDLELPDAVDSAIPLILEMGYSTPQHYFGAYFQYAKVDPKTDIDVSGRDTQFGIEARLKSSPTGLFTPWLGFGIGYEWLSAKSESPYGSSLLSGLAGLRDTTKLSFEGWQFARIEIGADYQVNPNLSWGPVLGFSLARFDKFDAYSSYYGNERGDISPTSTHGWFLFSLRAAYRPDQRPTPNPPPNSAQ